MEERLIYRFGDSNGLEGQEVFESHFQHLKEHQTLLFTTSSRISLDKKEGMEIIFLNKKKSASFKGIIAECGQFKGENPLPPVGFDVPKEFSGILNQEREDGFRWFAIKVNGTVVKEPFGKKKYRLSRIDAIESLGENETPFRYVLPFDE